LLVDDDKRLREYPHISLFLIPASGIEFRRFIVGLNLNIRYTASRDPRLDSLQQRSTDPQPPLSGTYMKLFDAGEIGGDGHAGTVDDHGDADRSAFDLGGEDFEAALLDRATQPVHELVWERFAISQDFFE